MCLYPFCIRKGNEKSCNFKKACRNTAFNTKANYFDMMAVSNREKPID